MAGCSLPPELLKDGLPAGLYFWVLCLSSSCPLISRSGSCVLSGQWDVVLQLLACTRRDLFYLGSRRELGFAFLRPREHSSRRWCLPRVAAVGTRSEWGKCHIKTKLLMETVSKDRKERSGAGLRQFCLSSCS